MSIIPERLEVLDTISLRSGGHDSLDDGACLLEAASYIAGEPWSDHPECVCPVLAAFGRAWNDGLPDDERDRLLKPFIPRLVGTRSTSDVQDARAFLAADWAVRTFTPTWLRRAGLDEHAEALEALSPLVTDDSCRAAMPTIRAARAAAWDAARAAAMAAAWDAAWVIAIAAARAAAGDAAWDAAMDATMDAAGAAAVDAAGAAAGDALAGDALAGTVTELQASAVDLFDRMIRVGES